VGLGQLDRLGALAPAGLVDRLAHGDLVQPGVELGGIAKRAGALDGDDRHLLRDVLGGGMVAEDAQRGAAGDGERAGRELGPVVDAEGQGGGGDHVHKTLRAWWNVAALTDELISRAVAALVPLYREQVTVPEGTLALSMFVYFDGYAASQLAPEMFAIPGAKLKAGVLDELFEPHDPEGWEAEAVEPPNVDDVPEVLALLEHLNADEDDEPGLEAYLAALQVALHEALGVLVIVLDTGYAAEERDQLRAQLSDEEWAQWEAGDWLPRDRRPLSDDVVVSTVLGPFQTAAVYRHGERLFASSSYPGGGTGLDKPVVSVGSEPVVLAGLLPDGAVRVSVQDLYDEWHEGLVGAGAWLCALPHEARGGMPPVVFRDAAGEEVDVELPAPREPAVVRFTVSAPDPSFDREAFQAAARARYRREIEGSGVPLLWPAGADAPSLETWSWSSDIGHGLGLILRGGELEASIADDEGGGQRVETLLREKLEARLRDPLGARAAGRAVLGASQTTLGGTIEGKDAKFTLLAAEGRWVALHKRRQRVLTVSGAGNPPERLDMVRLTLDDVQSRFPPK